MENFILFLSLRKKFPLVRMRENTDQNNFEYLHFSRSVYLVCYEKYFEM